jgi:hypothetical protein
MYSLKYFMRSIIIQVCFVFLFLISSGAALSQDIRIINQGDGRELPVSTIFTFLEPIVNMGQVEFVATIEARIESKSGALEKLYSAIRKRAVGMGATCYKFNAFSRPDSIRETILVLDCYYAGETIMKFNAENQSLNTIFIFGNEAPGDKSITFHLNGEPKIISGGSYFKYELKDGEEVKINKGGFTGATVFIKWKTNQQPLFYTLSGFGLSGINIAPAGIGAGGTFNTGRIHPITNSSMGILMTQILNQGN